MPIPQLTLLYDGSCPLCRWEKRKLRETDRQGQIHFIDIQAPDFKAEDYGFSMETLMGRLHGITKQGHVTVGIDTLITTYRLAGWWWLYLPIAALPRRFSDRAYDAFARRRHRISARIGHWFDDDCDGNTCRRKP